MNPGKPLAITYADHTVWLLPEHALWWPAGRVLFVADLHLGKAATYRALGQPVPSGTTAENLRRLSQLITHYLPAQLVFLGDFCTRAKLVQHRYSISCSFGGKAMPASIARWYAATTTAAQETHPQI